MWKEVVLHCPSIWLDGLSKMKEYLSQHSYSKAEFWTQDLLLWSTSAANIVVTFFCCHFVVMCLQTEYTLKEVSSAWKSKL
jgi:hypothetical protein